MLNARILLSLAFPHRLVNGRVYDILTALRCICNVKRKWELAFRANVLARFTSAQLS